MKARLIKQGRRVENRGIGVAAVVAIVFVVVGDGLM